jgi:hypothetical protein
MSFDDLEKPISRALSDLPAPRAPLTLLPRVMTSVQALAARPWYARAWFTWPLAWQCVSITALLLLVAAVALSMPLAGDIGRSTWEAATAGVSNHFAGGLDRVEATMSGARVLWRALVAPVLGYAAIVVILMYLACAAVAVILNRAFFGKVLPS